MTFGEVGCVPLDRTVTLVGLGDECGISYDGGDVTSLICDVGAACIVSAELCEADTCCVRLCDEGSPTACPEGQECSALLINDASLRYLGMCVD